MQTVGWQDKVKRQLEEVQRWRQSGKSIAAWAQAHGVDAKLLMGWVTYEKRWRQKLSQGQTQTQPQPHLTSAAVNVAGGAAAKAAAASTGAAKPKQLKNFTQGFVAVRSGPVGPGQAISSALAHAAHSCAVAQPNPNLNPNPASVRIECALAGVVAGSVAGVVLHWPVERGHELAAWLKSMAAP